MTGRELIGFPPRCDVDGVRDSIAAMGGCLDPERPNVVNANGMSWYFVDVVRGPQAYLTRQSLGCDSRSDGCLAGGRWKSRSVKPAEVRGRIKWWALLIATMDGRTPCCGLLRHWYEGRFDGEQVNVGNAVRCTMQQLESQLRVLPRDVCLTIQFEV